MRDRTKAVLWLLGLMVTAMTFVVGAAASGVEAYWGGSGMWGAILVLCSAVGAVILGLKEHAISNDWPRQPIGVIGRLGILLSGAIALVATYLLIDLFIPHGAKHGWFWGAVSALGVLGAWTAFFGWVSERRLLAAVGHLVALFAPWGYGYPMQLLLTGLALAAAGTFQSSKLSSSTTS